MLGRKNKKLLFYKIGTIIFPTSILIIMIMSMMTNFYWHLNVLTDRLMTGNFLLLAISSIFLGTKNFYLCDKKFTAIINYFGSFAFLMVFIFRVTHN